jgi:hypothetical protein
VIQFKDGKKWNTSNENWNTEEINAMEFISDKTGIKISLG